VTGTAVASPRQTRRYDEETIETALTVTALCGGNTRHAVRRLKEQGIDVPSSTLAAWKDRQHAARYAVIRDERAAEIQRRVAVAQEDVALKAAQITSKLLDRLDKEALEIPIRDLAGAVRNVATTGGIGSDKLMTLRERPLPAPTAGRDVAEILRALTAMGVVQEIGNTPAPAITDAEVVEEGVATL
jgi:hypothetical protein